MSQLRRVSLFAAVASIAAALGYIVHSATRTPGLDQPPVSPLPIATDAATLMAATLPDLGGRQQALAQWRGKVLVVNFWATWCAPCREEIPALIQVQRELGHSGVQIVGIAIDQAGRVGPYAEEMRINYPVLIGELDAIELSRAGGNALGGLPFTVILDRTGRAAGTVSGRLTADKLQAMLRPLL